MDQEDDTDNNLVEFRSPGRPKKRDAVAIPWPEIEKILVLGETTQDDKGGVSVRYPSYRELALRYNVSPALIGRYAAKRKCMARRDEAIRREQSAVETEVIKRRAKARALSTEDELQIIDDYLIGFQEALSKDQVRFDNPSDFNTMLRLKEFKLGRADQRQEINGTLSLAAIQARHQNFEAGTEQMDAALTGDVVPDEEKPTSEPADSNPDTPSNESKNKTEPENEPEPNP